MPRKTPGINEDSADRFSFLLAEFKLSQTKVISDMATNFSLTQSTIMSDLAALRVGQGNLVKDVEEIKNDIMGVKRVLFEKRDGKDSIYQTIDTHTFEINDLKEMHRKQANDKSSRWWDIILVIFTSVLTALFSVWAAIHGGIFQ
jgi:DNA-binding transcriptional ArsR family regulator